MKRFAILAIAYLCVISTPVSEAKSPSDFERYWHQWRGPYATGVAPHADPPIEWNENRNLRWKVEIPGKGLASPVVWEDKVFVLTAIKTDKQIELQPIEDVQPQRGRRWPRIERPIHVYKFDILAINRGDGRTVWQKTVREEVPHEGAHSDASWASNSAVTDGEHVYAYFGSRGLYCLDMDGKLQWQKDLGDMQTKLSFGEGSSPALHGDTLVLNWDHEGESFIIALDKRTGEERWKVERDEATSWATPIVVEHAGQSQVICPATNRTRSYDLANGDLIWQCAGMTRNAIPSPVSADGFVYLISGFRGSALQAINLAEATGDITDSDAIAWTHDRDTPYVPSPLLYDDTLYFLKGNDGILSCFNAETGEAYYGPERLEGISGVYASPVGVSNRVYIVDRDGATLVVKRGPTFEILAINSLDDGFDASPAIVDNEIYLRGRKYLYCIAAD